jgi:ADP-ribose pyrophosphatase YjhB (NUDIX family)
MKKISAGLAIVYDNKILLVHPTNASWYGTYSIPKGRVESGETYLKTAIREVREETGIDVPLNLINKTPHTVSYKNKTVYYFIVNVNKLSQLKLNDIRVPKKQLQLEEVDWAGFVDLSEAKKRMFKKQFPILDVLINNSLLEFNFKTYNEYKNSQRRL